MPLIIITGFACSGKSYRAQQIADALSRRIAEDSSNSKRAVQTVNSHHTSLDGSFDGKSGEDSPRDQIYTSAAREKTARAEEFSTIKRAVSKDNIVIADGLNYIKGYRYQLWCEAKAAGTRCCVVHVAAQEEECKEWNNERLRVWGREAEIEERQQTSEDRDATKQGNDVLGNLMPESHTALYGDRVVEKVSRPRSSSMDRLDDEGEESERARSDDTMTLKSLYISDRCDADAGSRPDPINGHQQQNEPSRTLPTTPIPPPYSAQPYAHSTLTSLMMRYEPPSPFSRWDTPLFTIPASDAHPPYDDIWSAIFPAPLKRTSKKALSQLSRQQRDNPTENETARGGKAEEVRQHAATQLPRATSASALQILESTTLEVVRAVLAAAREQGVADGDGGTVSISIPLSHTISSTEPQAPDMSTTQHHEAEDVLETNLQIPPGTTLTQPLLQRLRRKYTQMQRGAIAHGREYVGRRGGREEVVRGFVGFLGVEMEG